MTTLLVLRAKLISSDCSKYFIASWRSFSRDCVIYLPYCFSLNKDRACFSVVITMLGLFSKNFDELKSILQIPAALVYLDTWGIWPSISSSVAITYVFAQKSVSWDTCIIRVHWSWTNGLPLLLPVLSKDLFKGSSSASSSSSPYLMKDYWCFFDSCIFVLIKVF